MSDPTFEELCTKIEEAEYVVVDPCHMGHFDGAVILAGEEHFFIWSSWQKWPEIREKLCGKRLVTHDVRRIIDWSLSPGNPVVDVKLLWGGDRDLMRIVKEEFGGPGLSGPLATFLETDGQVRAHLRACKTAQMSPHVPPDLAIEWSVARVRAINIIYQKSITSSGSDALLSEDTWARWRFILAVRQIERSGIRIDVDAVEEMLKSADTSNRPTLQTMQKLQRGGFVASFMNPIGTKTGRLRYEAGFNCLAISRGARKAIVSRHEGGLIYTFDFNAVDYRCIVRSIGGEFAELYEGADDFHARTASFIFKEVNDTKRSLLKKIIYAYTYGGSHETLAEETGLTLEMVKLALSRLDEHIKPIAEFREMLYTRAQALKFVEPPGGRKVYVTSDDHAGKVLGLYAQTYSSHVFEQATEAAHYYLKGTKSSVIFTVYDELVADMHPDDFGKVQDIADILQGAAGGGWKVKVKKGRSYGEQA